MNLLLTSFLIGLSSLIFIFSVIFLFHLNKNLNQLATYLGKFATRYLAIYSLGVSIVLFKGAFFNLDYSFFSIIFSLIFAGGAIWFTMDPPQRADGKISKFKEYNALTGTFFGKALGSVGLILASFLILMSGLN